MSRSGRPVAECRRAWIAGLVILSLAIAWAAGTPQSRTAPAGASATALSATASPVDVAILTASGATPRLSEVRPGHDPDDMALHSGAACVPPGAGTDGVPRAAVEARAERARALPQARAPPLA